MIICSLKLTHDGTIALIDNGKLIFSYEMEKLNNNPRYSELSSLYTEQLLDSILNENGYERQSVDRFVIDGWGDVSAEHKNENDHLPFSLTLQKADNIKIEVNGYGLKVKEEQALAPLEFSFPGKKLNYNSYLHVSGHIFASYCTSPFAKKKESSFIMVWDGGMFAQVFYFNAETKNVENLGPIVHLLGDGYAVLGSHYYPFDQNKKNEISSVAGKLMAYIALGEVDHDVLLELKRLFYLHEAEIQNSKDLKVEAIIKRNHELIKEFLIYGELKEVDPKNMLATYHVFFQEILLENLQTLVDKYPSYTKNICLAGGCALNIKWNSFIRDSGTFKYVWIPPFPNDSGSAIGAACCEMVNATGEVALNWNVYSGPVIKKGEVSAEWLSVPCSLEQLAGVLYYHDEPVLFLNDRAELGPRALGNRSILASPVNFSMKTRINMIKKREDYRPIAPICIENDAPEIFSPGSSDPFMLFDHKVRDNWKDKIPAVCHLDGTARLQTVNELENPSIFYLLQKFKELSGIPLLCNTSANLNGSGFFPDIASAMSWGQISMIWSNNEIFVKKEASVIQDSKIFKSLTQK
jgi:carbamoyltransferase